MKKYIAGVATGLLIALPIGVLAGTGIHDTKLAADTKLVVNGKKVNTDIVYGILDNAKDGKNYVSARDLSEALGYDVAWDGESKEIKIGKGDSMVTPAETNANVADASKAINKYTPPQDLIHPNNGETYFVVKDGINYCTPNFMEIIAKENGFSFKYDKDNKQVILSRVGILSIIIKLEDIGNGQLVSKYDDFVDVTELFFNNKN